jgi:hypothetical protein
MKETKNWVEPIYTPPLGAAYDPFTCPFTPGLWRCPLAPGEYGTKKSLKEENSKKGTVYIKQNPYKII